MAMTSNTMNIGLLSFRCITTSPSSTVPGLMRERTGDMGSAPLVSPATGRGCFPFMDRSTKTTVFPVNTMRYRTPSVFSLQKYPFSSLLCTSSRLCRWKLTGMHPMNFMLQSSAGGGGELPSADMGDRQSVPLLCMNFLSAPHCAKASLTAALSGCSLRSSSASRTSWMGLICPNIHQSCWASCLQSFWAAASSFSFTSLSVVGWFSSISIS
mmetsp:Transcript_5796/g.12107  ORF Transcript_5796/g.12107 Transcript_5796/m.12107 type:complete len:212 (+) Transcript_5796:1192-1827(+)